MNISNKMYSIQSSTVIFFYVVAGNKIQKTYDHFLNLQINQKLQLSKNIYYFTLLCEKMNFSPLVQSHIWTKNRLINGNLNFGGFPG